LPATPGLSNDAAERAAAIYTLFGATRLNDAPHRRSPGLASLRTASLELEKPALRPQLARPSIGHGHSRQAALIPDEICY
jgi:hypothetical protein